MNYIICCAESNRILRESLLTIFHSICKGYLQFNSTTVNRIIKYCKKIIFLKVKTFSIILWTFSLMLKCNAVQIMHCINMKEFST